MALCLLECLQSRCSVQENIFGIDAVAIMHGCTRGTEWREYLEPVTTLGECLNRSVLSEINGDGLVSDGMDFPGTVGNYWQWLCAKFRFSVIITRPVAPLVRIVMYPRDTDNQMRQIRQDAQGEKTQGDSNARLLE